MNFEALEGLKYTTEKGGKNTLDKNINKFQNSLRKDILGNKGITLISLVVTIIVLMILAGVAVAALMGDNGIIKRAGEAKESQRGATVQDEVTLAISENKMTDEINKTRGVTGGLKTKETLVNELVDEGYLTNDDKTTLETTDTITIGSVTIDFSSLPKEGSGGGGGSSLDATGNIRITDFLIAGTPVTTPPKPDNFYYVGGTVDSGYVISNNASDENKYASSINVGTDLQGDQFVWVPVDKDQEFSVTIEGSGNITSVVLTNPVGDTKTVASNITAPIQIAEITPAVGNNVYNGEYKVTVTPQNGEAVETTLDVYSLYAVNVKLTLEYFKSFFGNSYESSMQEVFGGEAGCISSFTEPTDTDIDYSARVAANGGFWIGRYEASYNSTTQKPASKLSTSTRTSFSTELSNGMLWNYISRANALTTAKGYNTALNSSIPTGAAWDRTLGWIYEKRSTTGKSFAELLNSSSWGNYSDDTFSETTGLINTGAKEQTMANNIYDLAGNLEEWSTENFTQDGSTYPVSRGGNCYYSGSDGPATCCSSGDGAFDSLGLRLVLYK